MFQSFEVDKIAGGFQFVEGPVWLSASHPLISLTGAETECLIFSDIPASRLYWLRGNKNGIVRESTGQANGNTLDSDGGLLSCEHLNRRVSRMTSDGTVATVIDRYQNKRLNSPNDIVVRSDGLLFFTDPPYGVREDARELNFQGLYCLDPKNLRLKLLRDNFEKPNGLAFSVDEEELFVADTEVGRLIKFSVDIDGSLSNERVFCECDRPDGIRLDQAGNVWTACLRGIEIFGPDGRHIASIELPERPANLTFGDADYRSVYICARTSIYRTRSEIPGAMLPTRR
jgi:gluconolactonase